MGRHSKHEKRQKHTFLALRELSNPDNKYHRNEVESRVKAAYCFGTNALVSLMAEMNPKMVRHLGMPYWVKMDASLLFVYPDFEEKQSDQLFISEAIRSNRDVIYKLKERGILGNDVLVTSIIKGGLCDSTLHQWPTDVLAREPVALALLERAPTNMLLLPQAHREKKDLIFRFRTMAFAPLDVRNCKQTVISYLSGSKPTLLDFQNTVGPLLREDVDIVKFMIVEMPNHSHKNKLFVDWARDPRRTDAECTELAKTLMETAHTLEERIAVSLALGHSWRWNVRAAISLGESHGYEPLRGYLKKDFFSDRSFLHSIARNWDSGIRDMSYGEYTPLGKFSIPRQAQVEIVFALTSPVESVP